MEVRDEQTGDKATRKPSHSHGLGLLFLVKQLCSLKMEVATHKTPLPLG